MANTEQQHWRVLTSRTWCKSPRLRICLWGALIYLFLRAYNQVQEQCKAWGDILLFNSVQHPITRKVSEASLADLEKCLWLSKRDKTQRRNRYPHSIVLPKMDGAQAKGHISSLSPYSMTLFLVLLPFPIDPDHLAALQDPIQQATVLKIFWIVMWQGWPVLEWKQPSYSIWNWPKQLPYWILFQLKSTLIFFCTLWQISQADVFSFHHATLLIFPCVVV